MLMINLQLLALLLPVNAVALLALHLLHIILKQIFCVIILVFELVSEDIVNCYLERGCACEEILKGRGKGCILEIHLHRMFGQLSLNLLPETPKRILLRQ